MVTTQNTTENINENSLNWLIVVKKFQGCGQRFSLSWTSNIKEVGGRSTVKIDNVHGAHGEASTVDEAANVAANVNVVKVKLFGVSFLGIILSKIFLVSEFFLAVKRVRVNGNFGVGAENTFVICKNEGVDFNHVTIFSQKHAYNYLKRWTT